MNFFKQIGSAVDKINAIGNMTHQKNFFGGKPDPLTELIRTCSYTDEVKFTIEKSVKQVTQVYPSFVVDKLEYAEGGYQKRFIEIKGEIQVELRGKIKLNIMYPATFPKTAPYFRIINPNPVEFVPTNVYLPLQSKNDTKSFVLNERLDGVKKWNSSTSVVSLVIEANNMIKVNFPFQPISQQQQPVNNSWGSGYNQGFSQNTNQYPNQITNQYPNQYPNQYNQYQQPQGYNQVPKQPPIPFQTANYANCYPKAHQLVVSQRKKLQEISALYDPTLANIQNLSATNYALESQSTQLHNENQKLLDFVYLNSNTQDISLHNVVAPADRISEQILDLTASMKAREDAIHLLQSKFNEQEINLEGFMKNVRRMEQGKFEEKALLIKCLQKMSIISA